MLERTKSAPAVVAIALVFLAGCASVPLDYPKTPSSGLADTGDTSLATASARWRDDDDTQNGFYPLTQGIDAFGARLALMDRAERSIDAQYFLMKPDAAGLVFSAKLLQTADRGVRVRFLLDDIFTTVDDKALILMNEHPNIELRIFNPISRKGVYWLNYLGQFRLANRRMHNKSFTVDNQVAIVGGRNIAVEYFQLETSGEFIDFDMLCAGPVVSRVSDSFDVFWNHELAVPMDAFYEEADQDELDALRSRATTLMRNTGDSIYAEAVETQLMKDLFSGRISPYLADARVVIDRPEKLLVEVSDDQKLVAAEIVGVLQDAEREVIVFTPYFIPGDRGMDILRSLTDRGVRVILMTNSLATNNHTAVHSAYSSYRKPLLDAGVELWEARADAARIVYDDGTTELDQLTLHTKGLIVDRSHTFVGSLNLDPRSIDINTEMGILIDSPELGSELASLSLEHIPDIAYRLELDEDRRIRWHATIDGREIVETKEPQTSAWKRFQAWFLKIAPEKQL